MTAKKTQAAQEQQNINIHSRGAEYLSPAAWKKITDESIGMFASVILDAVTGNAEKRRFGNATIAYDATTIAAITESIAQIQKAITHSKAVWRPGVEETQARLPAARSDPSFQGFLKTLGDSTEVKDGGCHGTL